MIVLSPRFIARIVLGIFLTTAGISHFTWARETFEAQVPNWFPVNADLVILASGAIEVALGLALLFSVKYRHIVGLLTAGFFIAIFPGNIAQFVEGTDAFGLESDAARFIRLLFQPLLIVWALWATNAWPFRPKAVSSEDSSLPTQ